MPLKTKKSTRKQTNNIQQALFGKDALSRSIVVGDSGVSGTKLGSPAKKEKKLAVVSGKNVQRTKSANYLGLTSSFRGKVLTSSEVARPSVHL